MPPKLPLPSRRFSGTLDAQRRSCFAKEVRACLHIALAWSYIEEVDAGLLDEIERVIATLIRLIV